MSSEKKSPPTIVPKVVPPRPDEVTGTASRPAATNGTARPTGGGTTSSAPTGANAPVPPPPAPSGPSGGSDTPVPPPPASNGGSARSGALKAAAAAMATAKAAAKKLSEPAPGTSKPATAGSGGAKPADASVGSAPARPAASPVPAAAPRAGAGPQSTTEIDDRTVPRVTKSSTSAPAPGGTQEVPAMHYTAAGFSGTARPVTGTTPAAPAVSAPAASAPAAAASTEAKPAARPASDGPRRVRLTVSRVDPWSVMKLSFLLAVAIGIMTVVATAVFWTVLDGMGVFTEVNSLVESIVGKESPVDVLQFVEFNRVVALSTLIAIVNMVLITALSTIMAFIYNLVAAMVGGIHLTMTDD